MSPNLPLVAFRAVAFTQLSTKNSRTRLAELLAELQESVCLVLIRGFDSLIRDSPVLPILSATERFVGR